MRDTFSSTCPLAAGHGFPASRDPHNQRLHHGDLPRPECWDWFQHVDDALRANALVENSRVVGVAFEPADAAAFIDEMDGSVQPFFELLVRAEAATGTLLGYELVGAEDTLDFHSSHCHGYADELRLNNGITVNEHGLLRSYADASRALTWMLALPEAEAPKPVPWTVVALYVQP